MSSKAFVEHTTLLMVHVGGWRSHQPPVLVTPCSLESMSSGELSHITTPGPPAGGMSETSICGSSLSSPPWNFGILKTQKLRGNILTAKPQVTVKDVQVSVITNSNSMPNKPNGKEAGVVSMAKFISVHSRSSFINALNAPLPRKSAYAPFSSRAWFLSTPSYIPKLTKLISGRCHRHPDPQEQVFSVYNSIWGHSTGAIMQDGVFSSLLLHPRLSLQIEVDTLYASL